jgi:hypothetical protein
MLSGEHYEFPVEVLNTQDQPARLIGALEYCGGACYAVRGLPVTIPPMGGSTVTLQIEARVLGKFEEDVTLYTDRPAQPTLILKVRGVTEKSGHVSQAKASR